MTSFKIKDDKIYFQVFTFINGEVAKKLLKTIEDFKTIKIDVSIKKKKNSSCSNSVDF